MSTNATTFSAMDFWELMRVEASHWYWSFPLMFTFIICNKKLRFYCDFCHEKVLKKICQHFSRPISDFCFSKDKSFLLFFLAEWSPRCIGNTLGPFRNNHFIRFLLYTANQCALFKFVRQAFYFLTLPWVIRDKTDRLSCCRLGLLGYIHIFVRLNWPKFEGKR